VPRTPPQDRWRSAMSGRSGRTRLSWMPSADRLAECGARHGFTASIVPCHESPEAEHCQPSGFFGLMKEVRQREAQAVIVPSPAHLSVHPDVRRWMARMIAGAGAQLVVLPQVAVGVTPVTPLPGPVSTHAAGGGLP